MKILSAVFALFACISIGPAFAACEEAPEIVSACKELDAADAALNTAYRNLLDALNHPPMGMVEHNSRAKQSVILAQRAWLKFRDLDCSAAFDIADGTSKNPLSIACEAEHNLTRAKQLQEMASGL